MDKLKLKDPVYIANEFVEARYKFTALEIDIICRVIQLVNGTHFNEISLKIDALIDDIGTESNNNYSQIRKAFKNIRAHTLEIYSADERAFIISGIISGAKIIPRMNVIHIHIDPFMLPYLCDLKRNYTSFEIQSMLKMSGVYSKRIYMMVSQFKATGLMSIGLSEMRERLKLADKYKEYTDFRKRVIDPAVKEINEFSELECSYSSEKGSYAVERIDFSVQFKIEMEQVTGREVQRDNMRKMGLSQWQIDNVCAQKSAEEMKPILWDLYLRLKDRNQPAIHNIGAWVVKCLKNEGIQLDKPMARQLAIEH